MKTFEEFLNESSFSVLNKVERKIKYGEAFRVEVDEQSFDRVAKSIQKIAHESDPRMKADIIYFSEAESPEDIACIGNTLPQWAKELDIESGKPCLAILDVRGLDGKFMNALIPMLLDHEVCGKEYKNLNFCLLYDATTELNRVIADRTTDIKRQ